LKTTTGKYDIFTCSLKTPLGNMTAVANNGFLTALWFENQKHFQRIQPDWIEKPRDPLFIDLREWLSAYFSGLEMGPLLSLNPKGSPFQQTVWSLLLKIPWGTVKTYGEIANTVAHLRAIPKMSAQAVGGAVGRNPIAILIPCHRVIGSGKKLTGYAGGFEKKRALLAIEGISDILDQ
jgi:methylated-DNA-[protein]-cysteine S-methyltransferase